jgi:hypothetical protein
MPSRVTLAVRAGDAVVIDYRLLHGTHPNRRGSRLDPTPAWAAGLLPRFDGARCDLPLNRVPPTEFGQDVATGTGSRKSLRP